MGNKQKKRADKMRQNPKNVPFHDIETLLLGLGFEHRSNGTSHHVFKIVFDGKFYILTVPMKRPHVGRIYVEQMLSLLDEIGLLDDVEDDQQ